MTREFMSAIRRGDIETVLRLIPTEEINLVQERGLSQTLCNPLEMACLGYSISIIRILIEHGATFSGNFNADIIDNMMMGYHGPSSQITKMKIIKIMLANGVPIKFFQAAFSIVIPPYEGEDPTEALDYFYLHIVEHLRTIDRFNIFPEMNNTDFIDAINNHNEGVAVLWGEGEIVEVVAPQVIEMGGEGVEYNNDTQETYIVGASQPGTDAEWFDTQSAGVLSI